MASVKINSDGLGWKCSNLVFERVFNFVLGKLSSHVDLSAKIQHSLEGLNYLDMSSFSKNEVATVRKHVFDFCDTLPIDNPFGFSPEENSEYLRRVRELVNSFVELLDMRLLDLK